MISRALERTFSSNMPDIVFPILPIPPDRLVPPITVPVITDSARVSP